MVLLLNLESVAPTPYVHSLPPRAPELPKNNPNAENALAMLLAHYPAVASIASYLDHNDLQNLAMTCHHFRCSLYPVRKSLVTVSLRCSIGKDTCAPDLVNPCLKCRSPICRNCKLKTKLGTVGSRLRRLCPPCQRSSSAAAPPYCTCYPDPWMCSECFRELRRQDERYRILGLSCAEGYDMPVRGISDGGKLRCARGRQRCLGLEDDPKVIVEESTTDSDESAGTEEMSEGSGADQWDPLTVALDGMGTEFSWGKVDKRMSANAAMGGRVLKLEASKWDMLKEWQGELRGWCAWCDRVALSNADKRRLGIPIE